jgi:hypothetical protein
MANDVLTVDEQEFVKHHAQEIRQFADSLFAGSVDISKREVYQGLYFKAGGRQAICWTCGGSLRNMGLKLKDAWL